MVLMWICSLISLKTAVWATIWWEKKGSCPVVRTKNNFAFLIGRLPNTRPVSESELHGKSHFRNYLEFIRCIFRTESFCVFIKILRLKVDYLRIQHWLFFIYVMDTRNVFYGIGWKIFKYHFYLFQFSEYEVNATYNAMKHFSLRTLYS
jgi:hypothetical protein